MDLKEVGTVLGRAQDYLEELDYVQAAEHCLIVIRAMILMLESADDSADYIGDAITDSLDLINTIAEVEASIDTVQKGVLFELLAKESTEEIYVGWSEWSLSLLKVCVSLAETADQRKALEAIFQKLLEDNQENAWMAERINEETTNLRYQLILKLDGAGQAAEFNFRNLSIPSFRERAIKAEIAEGNYEQAESLALEGEEKDHEWDGQVFKWKQLRYEVYKLSNQLEKQQELAVEFVLDNNFNYYAPLKQSYPADDWSQIYPQLIQVIEQHENTFQSVYTQILVEEREWAKLLEHVKETPSLIELFYSYLINAYPNEVYELFNLHIEQMASQASSRKDYKGVAKVIKIFKKASKDAPVQETVQKLLDLYASKSAFQDELLNI